MFALSRFNDALEYTVNFCFSLVMAGFFFPPLRSICVALLHGLTCLEHSLLMLQLGKNF